MPPCGLRLQILRGLSQLTHTSVAELEVLFELKKPTTTLKRVPPKLKRMAPVGLELQIVRLLIAHPILVHKIDQILLSELEENVTSTSLLPLLLNVCREQKEPMSFAVFAQQLMSLGEEFTPLIKEIMQAPESELENVQLELMGAIKQMKMQKIKLKLDRLVATGLNTEEARLEYRELVAQQKLLRC
jgi:DNA primase